MKLYKTLFLIFGFFANGLFAQKFHINEDFNSGVLPIGWSSNVVSGNGAWSFGIDGSALELGNNNIDSTVMAFFDDDALGNNSLNNTAELYTPIFNNSTDSSTFLKFDFNFRDLGNSPMADSLIAEVYDGNNWQKVFFERFNNCGRYYQPNNMHGCGIFGFPNVLIDISIYKNPNCQIRFRYHDGNDWAFYAGLDNVEIFSNWHHDLELVEISSPISKCGLSANESISLKIKNIGSDTVNSFQVGFNIDNGNQSASEIINQAINPFDSLIYTFSNSVDLSLVKSFDYSIYLDFPLDSNRHNDTLKGIITNEIFELLPYFESFESSTPNWTISGVNSSLNIGIPNNTIIDSASDGQIAVVSNLNGNYNNAEISYVTSPCLDFSSTPFPILSFDLIFNTELDYDYLSLESSIDDGQTWQKVDSSNRANNWYNNDINGFGKAWNGNSQGWIKVENYLSGLGNQSKVKLRFAFVSDISNTEEGFGIDNLSIQNADSLDLKIVSLLYPLPRNSLVCGYKNSIINVEIQNLGFSSADTVYASFQVENGIIFTDTILNSINPFDQFSYTFKTLYNFSSLSVFSLSVWLSAEGDTIQSNDSLMNLSINNTSTPISNLPFLEDFETFSPGSGVNNQGFANTNGWVSIPDRLNDYAWGARNTPTSSVNTGPLTDHSLTGNTFIYTEASNCCVNDTAIFESPCISLSNSNNTQLEFYYHKYGSSVSDLFVDVFDGNQWLIGYDTVVGQTHFSQASEYLRKNVDLSAFKNRTVKTRFRTIKINSPSAFRNDVAIDDVIIYDQKAIDSKLNILFPPDNSCILDSNELISVEIENFGSLPIPANSIQVNYQIDNSNIVKDTLKTLLEPDSTVLFTFSSTANFSIASKVYNVSAWTKLIGDTETYNDSILNLKVENLRKTNGYIEDFESFIDNDCFLQGNQILVDGWTTNNLSGSVNWTLQDLVLCPPTANGATPSSQTGPAGDHTRGFGKFMYLQTNSANNPGHAELISGCLDLTNETSASVSFWYHKYGVNIGNLSLLAKNDTSAVWDTLITIVGQTQTSHQDPWLQTTASLSNYVGNNFRLKFVGTSVGGFRGDAAIDDINIYDPLLTEVIDNQDMVKKPSLYPNPNNGSFMLMVPASFVQQTYQLFDMNGRLIQEGRLSAELNEFRINAKSKGIYFLRIAESNFTEKIIVY